MNTDSKLNRWVTAFHTVSSSRIIVWVVGLGLTYFGMSHLSKYNYTGSVFGYFDPHRIAVITVILAILFYLTLVVFVARVATAVAFGYDVFSRDYKDGSLAHLSYTRNHLQPHHGTEYSAGWDLRANIGENATIDIEPGMQTVLGTGVKMVANNDMANGYFGMLVPRSSLSKKGLIIPNSVGIIDRDYSGEIKVVFNNISDQMVTITDGERIAQIICVPFMPLSAREVEQDEWNREDLNGETRGAGGFGSTGDK